MSGFFTDRSPHRAAPFQDFWRCAHHPSALDNRNAGRTTCEWSCHTQKLEWWHNGTHPMPKSWAARDDIR